MNEISPIISRLVDDYSKSDFGIIAKTATAEDKVISIDHLTSSAVTFYERMRSVVDNKDRHLIRWYKIHRTLGSLAVKYGIGRLAMGDPKVLESVAIELLKELISSGFLPNNAIPKSANAKLRDVILKYALSRSLYPGIAPELQRIAASEVEKAIYGNSQESFVRAMYKIVRRSVEHDSASEALDMQVYLACRLALLEDDSHGLFYGAFAMHFALLPDGPDKSRGILTSVNSAKRDVENLLHRRIARRLRDISIYMTVVRRAIEKGIDFSSEDLGKEIAAVSAELRDSQAKSVKKSGTRAFWYILVTKTAVVLPLEYLISSWFFAPVEMLPIYINLLFHPLLLLVLVKRIKPTSDINRDMVTGGAMSVIEGRYSDAVVLDVSGKKFGTGFMVLYLFVGGLLFAGLVFLLSEIGFSWISIVFFLVLLPVISFFAFRVRTKARKYVTKRYEKMREGMQPSSLTFLVLTTPLVEAGRKLSDGYKSVNIFIDLMDYFIEVPFKTLVRSASTLVSFMGSAIDNIVWYVKLPFVTVMNAYRKMKEGYSSFTKDRRDKLND